MSISSLMNSENTKPTSDSEVPPINSRSETATLGYAFAIKYILKLINK